MFYLMIGSTGVVSKIDFNCKPTYLIIGVWPTARHDVTLNDGILFIFFFVLQYS